MWNLYQTRNQTHDPCIGWQILNHWTSGEVLVFIFVIPRIDSASGCLWFWLRQHLRGVVTCPSSPSAPPNPLHHHTQWLSLSFSIIDLRESGLAALWSPAQGMDLQQGLPDFATPPKSLMQAQESKSPWMDLGSIPPELWLRQLFSRGVLPPRGHLAKYGIFLVIPPRTMGAIGL